MHLKYNSKNANLSSFPYWTIKSIWQLRLNRRKNRKTRKTKQTKQNGIKFRNLKQILTGNDIKEIIKNHRIGTINARSMKNKQEIIHETIEEYQLNITLITETWLKNSQDNDIWINSLELNNGKYNMFTSNRPHQNQEEE